MADGRNILICLDGTKNEVKAKAVTNVFKVAEIADLTDPDKQVLYYGPGVGTMAAPSAWSAVAQRISLLGGMLLGHGMRQDIAEAYTFLMNAWRPGDKVFVFGFSRGAYTARALCGMLYRIGLMRPGSDNLVPYAVRVYARRPGKDSDLAKPEGWDRMDKFSEALSITRDGNRRSFPIEYLGIYDTVKATKGIGRDIRWPYTITLPNIRAIRHAVSIDEKRRPYPEYLVRKDETSTDREECAETWFAGVHSDVGGGFVDNPQLGRIAMRWVIDGAIKRGLVVRRQPYMNRFGELGEADACAPMHEMGWYWRFAQAPWYWLVKPWRHRPIPEGATIHESVDIRRSKADPQYRVRLPTAYQVDSEPWSGPPPDQRASGTLCS